MTRADRPITLTYTVVVKTYGEPSKMRKQIGKTIAKQCRLNFLDYSVTSGKSNFQWSTADHEGGLIDGGED